ncbi:hypothetical protein Aduo_009638 [Ancylostoma duodenale]
MDVPSTSFANLANLEEPAEDGHNAIYSAGEDSLGYDESNDPYPELLGFVEAQIEFCDQFLIRIGEARKRLAEKKAILEKKAEHERLSGALAKAKVPVIQYLPPYFKDENMMCPPQNEEAKHKLQYTTYDPLIKEDKKWTPQELRMLREAVKESVIHAGVQKFIDKKDVLRSKLQRAGVDTAPAEIVAWKEELEAINRKIQHYRNGIVDSQQVDVIDYSCVDWLKISTIEFKGSRSAATLRYKWLNEQCPRWNSGPWTKEELEKLKEYREDPSFTSWAALAKKLQTQRSPYQCFERYRSDLYNKSKDWTKEEDDRLIALVKVMTVNGNVQWDKVTFYMPGRHRQQVRSRYQRTLDENVRHGRWTDQEDLLLMSAVARFGAKDWGKIAKAVVGRSDGQCRERWCNVLDRCTEAGDWTAEEDERLLLGIHIFGRGKWSKIAEILPRHHADSVKRRYQQLLSAKMRMCTARLSGRSPNHFISSSLYSVAKAKRDVLRQQLTDDSLKGECYRAAKEQARRITKRRAPRTERSYLTPEEKAIVEKGIEEIAEKFRNGENTPDLSEIIKKIDLSEREIASIITAAKKRSQFRRARQVMRVPGMVKKIKKNSHLLPDSVMERTTFRDDETEEERIMCMTEALCQAVRKYDFHEWNNKFHASRDQPESVVSNYVSNMLDSKCEEVAISLRECTNVPADSTLPPTFTSSSAYRVFERVRPPLTNRASRYFYPSNYSNLDIVSEINGDVIRKFTVHDRLSVRLHPNVLVDPNYLKLKAQVRCLLFEPTLLAMAIEPPEVEELRLKKQMELVQMEIDEENYVADAVVMDEAVAGEVEVTTEDYEPLYYEDIVDDALNATVRTVVDKVCYTPPKRKRGRPRKDDLLAACERGARVNRRQSLPRSAKNNMPLVVMEANSVSDDDLSLGGYDSDPGQSELSQEQDTYIEVALTDEDHVQDVMQSILEQVCRMVDQPKRKRGRPRKSDIAQQLVLEPKPKRR